MMPTNIHSTDVLILLVTLLMVSKSQNNIIVGVDINNHNNNVLILILSLSPLTKLLRSTNTSILRPGIISTKDSSLQTGVDPGFIFHMYSMTLLKMSATMMTLI